MVLAYCDHGVHRIKQGPIPVLFQNAPAAFDRVVFAMVRWIIGQAYGEVRTLGKLHQALHETWVRRLWLSGPLSRLMSRVVMWEKRSLTLSHQSIKRSTRQSLVTLDVTPKRKSSSEAGRKMPTGVTVATGLKSWSAALVGTRLLPPRAKGPTLTVALASIESRNTCEASSASSLRCFTWAKMASVSGSFFGAGSWPLFSDSTPTD